MANTTGKAEGDYTKSGGSVDGLYVFLAALNILLSITTSLSNALILIAFRKVTSIYPPTKLMFQCLAVTDICVGLVSQPLYVIYFLSLNTSLDSNWHVLFSIFNVTSIVLEAVLILISTAISVDRLVALFMGLRYRHVVTLRRVRALIICVWILSCALAALIQFGKEKIHSITLNFFLILIILCILASIICYTKIYLRLRYRQIQLQENQQQQGQPLDEGQIPLNIARYKKIVSSIAGVQLALLICYLPHTVLNILSFHDVLHVDLGRAIDVTFSFLFLNSTLNPILYCWKIKEVRQAVKDTIRFNCCPSSSG